MHARGSGEAARHASRAISHAPGHLRVSRFARRTTEKKERLLVVYHYSNTRLYVYPLVQSRVLVLDQ